jgi:glucose/arabinose dehydrogenase
MGGDAPGRTLVLRLLIDGACLAIALFLSRWLTAHFEMGLLWNAQYTRISTGDFAVIASLHAAVALPVLGAVEWARRSDAFASFRRSADLVCGFGVVAFCSGLAWFFLTQIHYRPTFTLAVAAGSAILASLASLLLARSRNPGWTEVLRYPLRSVFPWLALLFAALSLGSALVNKKYPPFRFATNELRLALHSLGESSRWTTRDFLGGVKLRQPMQVAQHPDKDNVYLVLERGGAIVAADTDSPGSKRTLLHLGEQYQVDTEGESGALGLALAPRQCRNTPGALEAYVYFTAMRERRQYNILLSVVLDSPEPQARTLIDILHHAHTHKHNGGGLIFDDDCFLYLGIGDGTDGFDHLGNSQRIDRSFYAGILRIDPLRRGGAVSKPIERQPVDGRTSGYFIPLDNPFVGSGALEEFWAIGLRNPFRIARDGEDGAFWVGDVGEDDWEEVTLVRRGTNHQWSYMEGTKPFTRSPLEGRKPEPMLGTETPPVFVYPHRALDRS